uniref:Uncharacterized protein n=1 Tax=Rhizophora mucronata TaxID=61149 RepID=A0A2P2JFF7_RHIMU
MANHAIPLSQQLQFKEYQSKLVRVAGSNKSASIIKGALYILSTGSGDFLQNYYINPWLKSVYTPDQYGSYLIGSFNSFVKGLYALEARKLGVTSLPPLGCLPAPAPYLVSMRVDVSPISTLMYSNSTRRLCGSNKRMLWDRDC